MGLSRCTGDGAGRGRARGQRTLSHMSTLPFLRIWCARIVQEARCFSAARSTSCVPDSGSSIPYVRGLTWMNWLAVLTLSSRIWSPTRTLSPSERTL